MNSDDDEYDDEYDMNDNRFSDEVVNWNIMEQIFEERNVPEEIRNEMRKQVQKYGLDGCMRRAINEIRKSIQKRTKKVNIIEEYKMIYNTTN